MTHSVVYIQLAVALLAKGVRLAIGAVSPSSAKQCCARQAKRLRCDTLGSRMLSVRSLVHDILQDNWSGQRELEGDLGIFLENNTTFILNIV